MNVSSATSSAAHVSQLQAQVKTLQSDLTQENASKTDDAKTKALKVMQYQLEITEDDLEIQQLSQSTSSQSSTPTISAAHQPATGAKVDIKA